MNIEKKEVVVVQKKEDGEEEEEKEKEEDEKEVGWQKEDYDWTETNANPKDILKVYVKMNADRQDVELVEANQEKIQNIFG